MKESFSIKFYLNPSKIRDGKQQIYTRLIVDREKAEDESGYISTLPEQL